MRIQGSIVLSVFLQGIIYCCLCVSREVLIVVCVSREILIVLYVSREHDKNPELFFRTLLQLKEEGLDFRVSVLGETFTDVPGTYCKREK